MKYPLLASLVSSCLFSAIVQTGDGAKIEVYSNKASNSKLVAHVSASKGRINKKFCSLTSDGISWCKIEYVDSENSLEGYVEEKLLQKFKAMKNKSTTYEASFGGSRDDVAHTVLALNDGALLLGYTESFDAKRKDAFVVKVDMYGNQIFRTVLGGNSDEILSDAIVVEDGYILLGTSKSYRKGMQSMYYTKISLDGDRVSENALYPSKYATFKGKKLLKVSDTKLLSIGDVKYKKFFVSHKAAFLNFMDYSGQSESFIQYGGDNSEYVNSAISVEDGYVLAGSTKSWGAGSSDMYVVKTDKKGKLIWQNAFGLSYKEVANQVIKTADGGFILVGTTDSFKGSQKDIYVVKISSKGYREWQKHYGTQQDEEGFGIAEINDGYVIAGYTKQTKHHSSDVLIHKIDREGNTVYIRTYGGLKDDKAYAIKGLKDGFLVAGYTTSGESRSKDMYLLRLDMQGMVK